MSDEKITTLAQVRAMTPHEIVAAQDEGRLDMAAIAAEKAAEADAQAERGRLMRDYVRNTGRPDQAEAEQYATDVQAVRRLMVDENLTYAAAAVKYAHQQQA